MPLTWDLGEIEDYKDLYHETGETAEDGTKLVKLDGVSEGFIWLTISVGMGHITRENAAEFYGRAKLLEKLDGPMFYKTEDGKREDEPITPEMVLRHVGLKTNVAMETRTKFLNRQRKGLGMVMDRAVRDKAFEPVTA